MHIGIPKEIKNHEYRVGLTPASVHELVGHGHEVWVQRGAGASIGLADEQYVAAGAKLAADAAEAFAVAEMIVKVKEPQPAEIAMLREGQILYTYLHLAPDPEQTAGLVKSGAVCVAYETVTGPGGGLPLLAPMSEVAGRMSIQVGATALQKAYGGFGVLLGGVPGDHEFDVTRAVKAGATLRIEEPWAFAPAVSYAVLQGLTDREPVLSLPDHPEPSQRRLVPDNRFRLVLTSNTTGQGEGLGTFVATEIQDSSTLNRITFRCKVDYMDPNKEVKIIEKAYPHINKDIGRKIIQFAGLLRKSHEQGILQEAFSPRNYLDWIAAAAACNNLSDGFKMTFYTIKNDREKAAIKEAWDYVKFAETL